MLKFSSVKLSTRAWAIPGLCGLIVLHHDFKAPRLTRVTRLLWGENNVEVILQYGLGNASGHVATSKDLAVILYRNGAVGVRELTDRTCPATVRMVSFLAGEVAREALRWGEARAAWLEGKLADEGRSVVLSLISAAVGIAIDDMQVEVAKDRDVPGTLHGLQLKSESLTIELIPLTFFGVSIAVNELDSGQPKWRRYAKDDVRDAQALFKPHRTSLEKKLLLVIRTIILLPIDFLLYLFDKVSALNAADRAEFVEYLPSAVLDPHAGETLSVLSNSHQYG